MLTTNTSEKKIASYGVDKAKTWRLLNQIMNRRKQKKDKINFLIDGKGNRIEKKYRHSKLSEQSF